MLMRKYSVQVVTNSYSIILISRYQVPEDRNLDISRWQEVTWGRNTGDTNMECVKVKVDPSEIVSVM